MTPAGLPHSDISGSTPVCDSPELFAANHVLHRLLTPRHPSCALSSLTTNLLWTAGSEELRSLLHENLLMASATKISRHAVRARTPYWRSELPGRSDCSLQARSRSKLRKGAPTSGIPSTLVSSKTRFRVVVHYSIFRDRSAGSTSTPGERPETMANSGDSSKVLGVERKGFEPLTPGLQSRCSPS
jgi:hypothetical protein